MISKQARRRGAQTWGIAQLRSRDNIIIPPSSNLLSAFRPAGPKVWKVWASRRSPPPGILFLASDKTLLPAQTNFHSTAWRWNGADPAQAQPCFR